MRPSWDAEPRRPQRPETARPPSAQPPNPPSPTPPGSAQAQSAADQYGGFTGQRKDESTVGEKDWDPQWEKRVNRLLPEEKGNLWDPEYRRMLNQKLRGLQQKQSAPPAAAGPAEEPAPASTGPAGATEPTETSNVSSMPVGQGSHAQMQGLQQNNQSTGPWPTRKVDGQEEAGTDQGQVDPVTGLPMGGLAQDQAAGLTGGQGEIRQTTPWPPPPLPPTVYTGGM